MFSHCPTHLRLLWCTTEHDTEAQANEAVLVAVALPCVVCLLGIKLVHEKKQIHAVRNFAFLPHL